MSRAAGRHPGPDRLAAFCWGKVNDAEAAEIAAHLGTCTYCQRMLETQPDDRLVALLRKVVCTAAAHGRPGCLDHRAGS
jgi:hypothetical protein